MADYKYVQEILTTGNGTEGSLLLPRKIHDELIMEVPKYLIPRELAAVYVGPAQIPGSSYDFNLQAPDLMDVRLVGEGAEIPMDQPQYTNVNSKPLKYGVVIKISREMMEDAKFPLLDGGRELAARRLAENENSLVVTALDGASNTISGGAQLTIANITRAIQYLEDSDFRASDIVIGFEALNDVRNIDTFVEYDKSGRMDMLSTGFLGTIYGLNVVRASTNAGMTTTSSYVLDRSQAYAVVEKRPVTVEPFMYPEHDVQALAITQRISVSLLRAGAVAKITTT